MSLSKLFDAIMDVIEFIELEGETSTIRNEASSHIAYLSSFDFAFTMHLMLAILGITHDLSQALQKKDQNIANAMDLVKTTKQQLETMRKDGLRTIVHKTSTFCEKHGISVPSMSDKWAPLGRPRRNVEERSYEFHYRIENFTLSLIYIVKSLELALMRPTLSFLSPWLV